MWPHLILLALRMCTDFMACHGFSMQHYNFSMYGCARFSSVFESCTTFHADALCVIVTRALLIPTLLLTIEFSDLGQDGFDRLRKIVTGGDHR